MGEIITLTVTGTRADADLWTPLTEGMKGCRVRAIFDDVWDRLSKRCVCSAGDIVKAFPLDADGIGIIPWECMIPRRVLRIGITGVDLSGEIRIPTVWVPVAVVQSSPAGAMPDTPSPSPTEIEQITRIAQSAEETANAAMSKAKEETARAVQEMGNKVDTALDELASAQSKINAAEGNRANTERERVASEEARVSAEGGRSTAENSRNAAENTRDQNEGVRKSNETARKASETKRVNAEVARASAEELRAASEKARQTAEEQRVRAEAVRDEKIRHIVEIRRAPPLSRINEAVVFASPTLAMLGG